MTETDKGQALLENAYELKSPADNVAYYRAFAGTYDTDFADAMGWSYPRTIAAIYRGAATEGDRPVADIGCGTGYVAQELGLPVDSIDGMDISSEMLAIARTKGLYRQLYEIDLTGALDPIRNRYGAVLSAGTFTHGHLGPEVLESLLGITRPGALFVIGVNKVHYSVRGFETVLHRLRAEGRITTLTAVDIPMYDKSGHEHSGDMAVALTFRRV